MVGLICLVDHTLEDVFNFAPFIPRGVRLEVPDYLDEQAAKTNMASVVRIQVFSIMHS